MTAEARRDLIVDGIYVVLIAYLIVNRLTDGRVAEKIEEKIRHTCDRLLHNKRINDAVEKDAPFVVFEAMQALSGEDVA